MLINSPNISGSLRVTGNIIATGSLTVGGTITGTVAGTTATASYVEYNNVANKPALVSGSAQIAAFGIFATTGSNQFNGNQAITGSLTTTGTIVAQTLNVQQVTSSIVYSSGSNIFGNSVSNTQQFTGSMLVTGSLTVTTNGTELQVTSTGVNLGNISTDTHNVTGSLRVTGSMNVFGSVGVGVTSPAAELQVGKSSDVTIAMSNSSSVTSGARGSLAWYNSSISTVAIIRAAAVTDNVGTELQFFTRPAAGSLTQAMTLDASGRLGIGTTSPQSWTRLEVSGTAGAQIDAAQQVIITAPTTTVGHGAGLRFNAASGAKEAVGIVGVVNEASGNLGAMTFHTYGGGGNIPERMRITSGGNVGIGLTSPPTRLSLVGGSTMQFGIDGNSGNNSIYLRGGTTGDKAAITLNHYGYADYHIAVGHAANTVLSLTKTLGGTDGIIINSSGNVGINTSSPTEGLVVATGALRVTSQALDFTAGTRGISIDTTGGNLGRIYTVTGTGTATDLAFGTNNTERMRITTGGNVGIGTNNPIGGRLHIGDSGADNTGLYVNNNTFGHFFTKFAYQGSVVGSISYNGSNTVYTTTSDYRLKQDIKDFNGLDLLSRIKTYDYEWKSDKTRSYGVLAHELQEVINYAVTGSKDAEEMQGVDYSKIVPILIKAIQELKAENDTLKSRIDTLEQA